MTVFGCARYTIFSGCNGMFSRSFTIQLHLNICRYAICKIQFCGSCCKSKIFQCIGGCSSTCTSMSNRNCAIINVISVNCCNWNRDILTTVKICRSTCNSAANCDCARCLKFFCYRICQLDDCLPCLGGFVVTQNCAVGGIR